MMRPVSDVNDHWLASSPSLSFIVVIPQLSWSFFSPAIHRENQTSNVLFSFAPSSTLRSYHWSLSEKSSASRDPSNAPRTSSNIPFPPPEVIVKDNIRHLKTSYYTYQNCRVKKWDHTHEALNVTPCIERSFWSVTLSESPAQDPPLSLMVIWTTDELLSFEPCWRLPSGDEFLEGPIWGEICGMSALADGRWHKDLGIGRGKWRGTGLGGAVAKCWYTTDSES